MGENFQQIRQITFGWLRDLFVPQTVGVDMKIEES